MIGAAVQWAEKIMDRIDNVFEKDARGSRGHWSDGQR
jgi:hypothetical protein